MKHGSCLEKLANGVEEPSMRIDLLLVLGLQDEYDLHRYNVIGVVTVGKNELGRGIDGNLGGILKGNISNQSLRQH